MGKETERPSYLFEVSWEVCNKVGGIHTVVSTKVLNMKKEYGANHILIGPDVWRNIEQNPEFTDDPRLFRSWRAKADTEGIRIKVGRWNVKGQPIVILVDFSTLMSSKDMILSSMWEDYKVDSLSGGWDYIEPVLFGVAAAKVIESFVAFNASVRTKVVAQFHEWMTGSGLLYLKARVPQIATAFTTHATVLGRCIAGNSLPLYSEMDKYDPELLAKRFNVVAKHSIEKISAAEADVFTTVSYITAEECAHFLQKKVDLVTPNGFEPGITPENLEQYTEKFNRARNALHQTAEKITGRPVSKDAVYVGIGGRYEFKNKGIDVFIDAMARLNGNSHLKRQVVAFILVPGGHGKPNDPAVSGDHILTHYLNDPLHDPVMNRLSLRGLDNAADARVKVIFAPCYLQGNDGVLNLPYYDLLIGMDMTLFPSYYEPWGYTPLESVAFSVPAVTTTLAGFGLWVNDYCKENKGGVTVLRRDDVNNEEIVKGLADSVLKYAKLDANGVARLRKNAKDISNIALWDNLSEYYIKAYQTALERMAVRIKDVVLPEKNETSYMEKRFAINTPTWVSVLVHTQMPEKLKALESISRNLWWSWNEDAVELFESVDAEEWKKCGFNPIALLDNVTMSRIKALENDEKFMFKLYTVYEKFKAYMEEKPRATGPGVSYFSMEYAIHSSLKIYSGGLGVLAGDYLKEASDKNTKMTAVGLLYRYGYFTQKLAADGSQEAIYEAQDFMKSAAHPVTDSNGKWIMVDLPFPGRTVHVRIWRVDVGRVELYLLDTDFEDNLAIDQSITHHLYGGDWENRLKQEIVLGCGGIQALRKLGIRNEIYHCNEGHAAFIGIERIKNYVKEEKLSYDEALEVVRASSLFTTHTPVPAGHDAFEEPLLRTYMAFYADLLKVSWEQLLGLGKINVSDPNEKFSMSFLAANLSQEMNGVSKLHGEVTKSIFKNMWPGYAEEESHIGYVTNGVHFETWTNKLWKEIYASVFGPEFPTHNYDKSCFEKIYEISDEKIMFTRNKLRKRLIDHIKDLLTDGLLTNSTYTPRQVLKVKESLRDDVLTIGFARRFATYKRAHLLFKNLDRLNEIVNNPDRPVQFVFAGKAHPADRAGQDLIKRIVEVSKYPQFIGKILFLPNYDMDLAKYLVQGVDVWMNMPTRPLEASGTSGEKAAMNGVMHFSVLDGWWVEGYRPDAGWMLPQERTFQNQDYQDELDSETVYNTIQDDIAPCFYDRDNNGISTDWVKYIKNTIAKVASNFTSNRMLLDYEKQYYYPMSRRYESIVADHYQKAGDLVEWKRHITREWNNIELLAYSFPDRSNQNIFLGCSYSADVDLEIGTLAISDVGVELVYAERSNGDLKIRDTFQFTELGQDGSHARYRIEVVPDNPGELMLAIRIYPKNPELPHRMDFPLVKWL